MNEGGAITPNVRICVFHVCGLLVLFSASCGAESARTQKPAQPQATPTVSANTNARANLDFDACGLITTAEVAAVMGQPVKETKGNKPSSNQSDPSFERWQCFYTAEPFDASVSLELTRNNPKGNQNALGEFWQKTFRDAKDKRKSYKPKALVGVGDEAFWVGDNKTGTLYVLKNNSYLRISIGGPGDETVKEEKLKALAQTAVKRL